MVLVDVKGNLSREEVALATEGDNSQTFLMVMSVDSLIQEEVEPLGPPQTGHNFDGEKWIKQLVLQLMTKIYCRSRNNRRSDHTKHETP